MEWQSHTHTQMQTQASKTSSRKRPVKKDKLSLEDYLDFLHSLQAVDLSMNHLNQIIFIHGFRKLHKQTKKVLVDSVNALELMDLRRSTLSQSVSASATLALEDVIVDLNDLGWQECCVTSVYSLNSCTENSPPLDQKPQVTRHLQTSSRAKTSEKSMDANILSGLLPKASQNSRRARKMAPKRRRINGSDALDCASTMDSVSLASN
ncbi:uncharacterized protein LOC129312520 [Prosopis cineraria]|uniref:uncharacterized protein LOC129312520 n=1 Tax=Prosopis cineraria TaxID=364024 RepID=UPI0024100FE1|nr:uncharacterized protein LOC129312520 [Prosopis cineraria]